MDLTDRQSAVLAGLVAEYIASGKPVGSEYLVQTLNLNVSPATIRNTLRDLEELGYIEQPHTSAGRIPTDAGYRHYVNNLVTKDVTQRQQAKIAGEFQSLQATYGHPARASAKLLAHLSRCLAISGWMDAHNIQEAGLAEILRYPKDNQNAALQEISELLEGVDDYLQQLSAAKQSQDGTQIYIGRENPIFDATHTASLIRTVTLPSGEQVVLLMVGPKRMPYQRNVALLETVASLLNNQ
jgi:transcriptional regulator of heat shock response